MRMVPEGGIGVMGLRELKNGEWTGNPSLAFPSGERALGARRAHDTERPLGEWDYGSLCFKRRILKMAFWPKFHFSGF